MEQSSFYLERSLHYTRGNRNQIAETLGRLGNNLDQAKPFHGREILLKRLISNYRRSDRPLPQSPR